MVTQSYDKIPRKQSARLMTTRRVLRLALLSQEQRAAVKNLVLIVRGMLHANETSLILVYRALLLELGLEKEDPNERT